MTPGGLPNFFVVGAPKTGTTSLYHALDQHPDVFMSPIKEPCFFAPEVVEFTPRARALFTADAAALRAYLDGPMRQKRASGIVLDWEQYLKLFKQVRRERAVGEASVSYLGSASAAGAIRGRVPAARIIMMLRDPVRRLFSHYAAARAAGATRAAFVPWAREQRDVEAGREIAGGPVWGPLWAGRYAVHLRRYYAHFPCAQVRVLLHDDYVRAPATVISDLLAFLDVDRECPIDVRHHNVTLVPRWPALQAKIMTPVRRAIRSLIPDVLADRVRRCYFTSSPLRLTSEERAQVLEMYADDIRSLETLIGRDLSAWRDPEEAAPHL